MPKLIVGCMIMVEFLLCFCFLAVYNLAQYPEKDHNHNSALFVIGVIVGIGNILQWSALTAPPVVQVILVKCSIFKVDPLPIQ